MAEEQRSNFNDKIRSYDIHTYYFQTNEDSKNEARQLREKVQKDFAKEIENGQIRVWKFHEEPIGPHPYAMWEIDFHDPEIYAKVVPWYTLNHGNLSVLIHPRAIDCSEYKEHTEYGLWLGDKVPLILSVLSKEDRH